MTVFARYERGYKESRWMKRPRYSDRMTDHRITTPRSSSAARGKQGELSRSTTVSMGHCEFWSRLTLRERPVVAQSGRTVSPASSIDHAVWALEFAGAT